MPETKALMITYFEYAFDLRRYDNTRSNHSFEWFNGLYWHSKSFAAGYGLKYFNDMTGGGLYPGSSR